MKNDRKITTFIYSFLYYDLEKKEMMKKMKEKYVCKCGKEYQKRGFLINHVITKKHYSLSKEEIEKIEKCPIDVKRAILRGDVLFTELNDINANYIEVPKCISALLKEKE